MRRTAIDPLPSLKVRDFQHNLSGLNFHPSERLGDGYLIPQSSGFLSCGFAEIIEAHNSHFLKEIAHFFKVYKDLQGKEVKIVGWEGAEEAITK